MGLLHALSGNPAYAAMWTELDALSGVCLNDSSQEPGPTDTFAPTPPGIAMALTAQVERPGMLVGPLRFAGQVPQGASARGAYPAVVGLSW